MADPCEPSYCCLELGGTQAYLVRTDNKHFSTLALGASECDLYKAAVTIYQKTQKGWCLE
jgi:hypothetical protein